MKRFGCFLITSLFIYSTSFTSTKDFYLKAFQEKEPSNLFDECVNIITGNFVYDDEIVVKGKEPINLNRSYFSLNNFDSRLKEINNNEEYILGGWSFNNLIKAFFLGDRIEIVQSSGIVYSFRIPYVKEKNKSHKKKDKEDKSNLQNLEFIEISYLPNFSYKKDEKLIDPKDLLVQLKGQNELFVKYPDGSQKYYKKENKNLNEYLLKSHRLLNHNKLEYSYDKLNRLNEIKSTNQSGNITYAWVRINYEHSDTEYNEKYKDKYDFNIKTSDGKRYEFKYNNYYPWISNKEKAEHPFFILEKILSNQGDESFSYHLDYKRMHPLMKSVMLPNKLTKEVSYYLVGNKNPEVNVQFFDLNDFRFERVKTLQEPLGVNGSYVTTYKFYYEQPSINKLGMTTIYDLNNNKYIYYYNVDSKIEKIQRFENINGNLTLLNEERYVWEKAKNLNHLICKSFLDKNLKVIFSKRYFYDTNNNVVEEKLYGNISGIGPEISLDEKNLPKDNCESFSKKYKYSSDNKNLLIEESDDSKIKINYSYLPNTNYIASKIIFFENEIKQRFFYEYNNDCHLIKEIEDDNSFSINKDEISKASYRKIKYFFLRSNDPFIGFIQAIDEKYLDIKNNEEKLVKKEVFTFSDNGKIIKKDTYDANNQLAYSDSFEFDAKGNLISKTDPLNRKTKFLYDLKNNKVQEILPNGTCISYNYDSSNQLIEKVLCKDDEKIKIQYFLDSNKNRVSSIDNFGNEIKYEYDSFSFPRKKIISKSSKEKKSTFQESYLNDAMGNISQISQNSNVKKITYNIFSKPTSIIYPDNSEERFRYNLDGTLKTFIDKEGLEIHFTYDYQKRITSKIITSLKKEILSKEEYKYNSFALEEEANNNNKIKYSYDFANRLIKKEILRDLDKYFEEYFYDNLSRKNKTVFNKVYSELIYRDLLDRVIGIEKTTLDGLVFYKKDYQFDEKDNLSIISYIEDKKSIEKHYLDFFGRILKILGPTNEETIFQYDDLNLIDDLPKSNLVNPDEENSFTLDSKLSLLEKRDQNGKSFYKEENSFDILKNLISKKLKFLINDKEKSKELLFSYNNMNRLSSLIEKENDFKKETKYSYTKKGFIKNIEKSDGIILENQVDDFGNILKITSSDKKIDYEFEYNSLNLPIKITDLINKTQIIRTYNNSGKLIEEKLANNLDIKNEYDSLSRKTASIFPDNSSVSYFYNPYFLNKVIRKDSSKQNRYIHEYLKYDLSGNMLEEKLKEDLGYNDQSSLDNSLKTPFGFESFKSYDLDGRVEKINWKIFWKNDVLSTFNKNFDELKNELNFDEKITSNFQQKIKYDLNGNISEVENENEKILFTYDLLNRLIEIRKNDYLIMFLYDGLNRKVKKDIFKIINQKEELISTFRYLYDDLEAIGLYDDNNRALELKILGRNEGNSIKPISYEISNEIFVPLYDISGNVTSLISFNQELVDVNGNLKDRDNSHYFLDIIGKNSNLLNPMGFLDKSHIENINLVRIENLFVDPLKNNKNKFPMNILSSDFDISYLQLEGISNSENKNELESLDISINNPFKGFDSNLFTKFSPMKNEKFSKINIRFSKDALSFMNRENIPLDFVLEVIKKPSDIQKVEDSKFLLTNKNYKVYMDMKTKEILSLEKVM